MANPGRPQIPLCWGCPKVARVAADPSPEGDEGFQTHLSSLLVHAQLQLQFKGIF